MVAIHRFYHVCVSWSFEGFLLLLLFGFGFSVMIWFVAFSFGWGFYLVGWGFYLVGFGFVRFFSMLLVFQLQNKLMQPPEAILFLWESELKFPR